MHRTARGRGQFPDAGERGKGERPRADLALAASCWRPPAGCLWDWMSPPLSLSLSALLLEKRLSQTFFGRRRQASIPQTSIGGHFHADGQSAHILVTVGVVGVISLPQFAAIRPLRSSAAKVKKFAEIASNVQITEVKSTNEVDAWEAFVLDVRSKAASSLVIDRRFVAFTLPQTRFL